MSSIIIDLYSVTLINYSSSLHIFRFMRDDTYKYVIDDVILGVNSVDILRISPAISECRDDEFENLEIGVIPPGIKIKTLLSKSSNAVFM